ncbi:MAG TPA: sensor histidine kinase [Saprospiraceae bacterium]|nr:sensor histidine kinase [Saprospiraceae bacterium]
MKRNLPLILILLFSANMYSQKSEADSLYKLGYEKGVAGDWDGATSVLLAGLSLAEKANNAKLLCGIYFQLGKISANTNNYDGVLQNINKGIPQCQACKDTSGWSRAELLKGVYYLKFNKLDSALIQFQFSHALFMSIKDTLGAVSVLAKMGNAYELAGDYLQAEKCYLPYYEATLNQPNSFAHMNANIFLAANYCYQEKPDKAKFHNDKLLALSQALNARYEYSAGLRYAALIEYHKKNFEAAYEAMTRYADFYQDSLIPEEQIKQVEALKAEYETEKKDAQILLQEEQLKTERFRFWALLGGLGLALMAGAALLVLIAKLRKRNKEKEYLIKEIHHRVKNNLQILSSLLHLQSRQITDDTALDAVREGQNRVDAMGLIHQKLYMGDHVAKVEMKDYLQHFGQNMLESFGVEEGQIHMEYEVEPLYLDVDTAIPLGLIINELVTNSLKYAFRNKQQADQPNTIRIRLHKDAKNHLHLEVADNGTGQSAEPSGGTGFGSNLIKMLSKKLKGNLEIQQSAAGYSTRISFEKAIAD